MPTELLTRAAHTARAGSESGRHAPSRRGAHPAPQVGQARTRHVPTFVFADLVGYTALTDQHGDEVATSVAREFHRVMRGLTRDHLGWTVKSMGDGVMLWVPDAGEAVALAARTVAEVGTRGDLLPVRVGVRLAIRCELVLPGLNRRVSAWRLS